MARKQTLDAIIQLYKKLGGNTSEVLGTKTNVNFLGKGKSPELMLDMDINQEALAVLPQSKAVDELKNSIGYAVSGKLNDIQANQLLKNMQTMESVYFPPAAPANITDMVTGTKGLDKAGLESLRAMADDLPPPGSRGGSEDISAPIVSDARAFTGEGLEQIKNVKNDNLIVNDIVDKIYLNAGVAKNAQPVARANAREFLNRVKDLEDPDFPGGTTLSGIMNQDDFRFMTEGGGGGMGDPMLLVQKYFGPKVASAVAQLDNADEIQKFAENLVKIKDARGNTITSRYFDPESVDPSDFEFADGGKVPAANSQLVKKSDEVLGYRGDDAARSDRASGRNAGRADPGNAPQGDGPARGGGGGSGGGGNNVNTVTSPISFSVRPDNTEIGSVPRFADIDLNTKYGIMNLRTDLFNTIKDQELDSELSFAGNVGPFNINAKTDFDDINQASFDYNKNNIYASGLTDFDDQNQLSFGYEKGPFRAGVTTDLDGNNQYQAGFNIKYADGGRVPFREGGGADARYMQIEPKFLTMKGISEDPSLKVGGFGLDAHDTFYDKFGKFLNKYYYLEKLQEKLNKSDFFNKPISEIFSKKTEKADGGIIGRDGYMAGMLVRGGKMGYQALRKYGIEGKDISRLFASLGSDKSLVGKEKTAYFQQLHKVLRNPDAFPDEIMDIQKQLGIDVGIGFRNGGLAGILEV